MKIKALIASLVLGAASMPAVAGPGHLFGISPFCEGPMHGARAFGPAQPGKPGEAVNGAEDKAAAGRRAAWMTHEMTRRIERVVRSVDGTPEQATKAAAIARAAADGLRPLREQMVSLDQRARELFKAPSIDKAAFAALRVERQKLMDAMSQRSLDAYVEMAALFSPEQRQKLAERMDRGPKGKRRHDGHRAHRGETRRDGQAPEGPDPRGPAAERAAEGAGR
ncbi:MAG: Spy/CpxP family protein refolding chaperone [Lautropia sp.]|nr:Spy/CpxP family protein refolding chaperone [Lautropia sp.]